MSHTDSRCSAVASGALLCWASIAGAASAPPDERIKELLVQRVETQKWATGIVVGISDRKGRRIIAYGTRAAGDSRPVDGDTVVEIASLTKVFTALLLADRVQRRELGLDDPVARCLPPSVTVPARNGRTITFADLATHSSGLPLRPTNLASQTALDKYAGYTAEQMYAALSSYTLDVDPGTQFRYSNWGFGLLGHALELCAKKDYESLLRERILAPLRMNDTAVHPTPAMRLRLAVGHDERLQPVPNGGHGVLDPAGSVYSTAKDLLRFLEATMSASAPDAAMATMLQTQRPGDDPATRMTLGWRITSRGTQRIIWSAGRADGYRSYMAYDPDARRAVVALANAGTNAGADDIGRYVLDPSTPPIPVRTKIAVPSAVLDRYVGRYLFEDRAILTVTREGDQLVSQMTDQGPVQIYPTSENTFFPEGIDAEIVFEASAGAPASTLTLHQDGQSWRAVRIPATEEVLR